MGDNFHFHVIVTDGVFAAGKQDGEAEFFEATDLTDDDISALEATIRRRVLKLLERHRALDPDYDAEAAPPAPRGTTARDHTRLFSRCVNRRSTRLLIAIYRPAPPGPEQPVPRGMGGAVEPRSPIGRGEPA